METKSGKIMGPISARIGAELFLERCMGQPSQTLNQGFVKEAPQHRMWKQETEVSLGLPYKEP